MISRVKKFSIDNAFESDDSEPIQLYGATTESVPLRKNYIPLQPIQDLQPDDDVCVLPISNQGESETESGSQHSAQGPYSSARVLQSTTTCKTAGSQLRTGSDRSLSSAYSKFTTDSTKRFKDVSFQGHPQVREHWKTVLASFLLLIAGIGLTVTGIYIEVTKQTDMSSFVFFITGVLCLIPGAYHLAVMSCGAARRTGFSFDRFTALK